MPTDDKYYRIVAEEIERGTIDKTLWTRSVAESTGTKDAAQSLYIRHRVRQLVDAESTQQRVERREEADSSYVANRGISFVFGVIFLLGAVSAFTSSQLGLWAWVTSFVVACFFFYAARRGGIRGRRIVHWVGFILTPFALLAAVMTSMFVSTAPPGNGAVFTCIVSWVAAITFTGASVMALRRGKSQ